METLNQTVQDFILFCAQRNNKEWPDLYDEMCHVAGRHLFRGMGYAELSKAGLSFGLSNIEETIRLVDSVVARNE